MANRFLSPPAIHPLTYQNEEGPLWSVMVLTGHNFQCLNDTLSSILLQDIPSCDMQIEVVAPADAGEELEEVVQEVGNGRVKIFRQCGADGILEGLEQCLKRARGRYIHILNSNDQLRSGFYHGVDKLFWYHPEAGAAFCGYSRVDENGKNACADSLLGSYKGILPDCLFRLGERNIIPFGAVVVKRTVYEKLGGFFGSESGADWEMWTRIARYFPVAYTPEVLTDLKESAGPFASSRNFTYPSVEDFQFTLGLIQEHLPENERLKILKRSRKYYAGIGFKHIFQPWSHLKNNRVGKRQEKKLQKHSFRGKFLSWSLAKLF